MSNIIPVDQLIANLSEKLEDENNTYEDSFKLKEDLDQLIKFKQLQPKMPAYIEEICSRVVAYKIGDVQRVDLQGNLLFDGNNDPVMHKNLVSGKIEITIKFFTPVDLRIAKEGETLPEPLPGELSNGVSFTFNDHQLQQKLMLTTEKEAIESIVRRRTELGSDIQELLSNFA